MSPLTIDWPYVWFDLIPALSGVVHRTILATVVGFAGAVVIGLLLAMARRSRIPWLRVPALCYIEFIRTTPILVQIYFLFFVLPRWGVLLDPWTTGLLAFALHYATYTSEVFRAGLDSIPKGQFEAAASLNMKPWHVYRDVIVPQAVPPVVPALGNYFIGMFKETPLLSTITIMELMATAKDFGQQTFQYFEPITLVGLFFIALSLVAAGIVQIVEGRLGRWGR